MNFEHPDPNTPGYFRRSEYNYNDDPAEPLINIVERIIERERLEGERAAKERNNKSLPAVENSNISTNLQPGASFKPEE